MFNVEEDLVNLSKRCPSAPVRIAYLVGDLGSLGSLRSLSEEDEGDGEDQQERDDGSLERSHDA